MPIPTYVPGYPPDGSSLGETKSTIRNNLDGTFETLGIDHVNNNGVPGSQPAGYHTVIHQVPQTSINTVSGYNQVFSGVPGTLVVNAVTTPAVPSGGDTQLYSLTGMGKLSQLTGFSVGASGYSYIGGALFQWGSVSITGLTFVTFPVAFPNACYSVTGNQQFTGSASVRDFVQIGTISRTGFDAVPVTTNGAIDTGAIVIYWMAVGS